MSTVIHGQPPVHTGPVQPVNAKGQPICGSKTRNSRHPAGTPCQNTAIGPVMATGFRRCRMHGGFTARGPLSPNATQGGRYSRYLPAKLRGLYDTAVADPAALSLREDVALLTARIELALQGLDGGASIGSVLEAWQGVEAAVATGKPAAIAASMGGMRQAIGAVAEQRAALREIERLQLMKGRLALVEVRRAEAAASMLDAASAWALVSTLGALVKTHVPDPDARRAIAEGLVRLTHRGALPRPE